MYNPLTSSTGFGAITFHRGVFPYVYTDIAEEVQGCKVSAMLGIGLNICSPTYEVSGPAIREFMTSICVNSFMKLEEGGIRHAIMCDEKGRILTDGVVLCTNHDTFRCYWLSPVLQYYVEQNTKYNITGTDVTGTEFFFQISGPKCLEILESAFHCDLHDIAFGRHRMQKVDDYEVRILRMGMSGNLGYEIHGDMEFMDRTYDKLIEAGKLFGMTRLGQLAYGLSHTEAGFPNINIHYPLPWYEHPGIAKYLESHPAEGAANVDRILTGSVGDDLECRFVNPYDVGWGKIVNFNHEFPGKAALEKAAKDNTRIVTTLEWNAEDIGKVYAAQFMGREKSLDCERIDRHPVDFYMTNEYRADKVFVDDKQIGISTGRANSYWYKRMISLAFIEKEYAVEGTEVTVLWGSPGKAQFKIRAHTRIDGQEEES